MLGALPRASRKPLSALCTLCTHALVSVGSDPNSWYLLPSSDSYLEVVRASSLTCQKGLMVYIPIPPQLTEAGAWIYHYFTSRWRKFVPLMFRVSLEIRLKHSLAWYYSLWFFSYSIVLPMGLSPSSLWIQCGNPSLLWIDSVWPKKWW